MAEEITLKVNLETGQAVSSLNKLDKVTGEVAKETNEMAVATSKSAKTLGDLENASEDLTKRLKKAEFGTPEFKELNQALKDVNRQVKNTELNMEALDNEQVASEIGSVAGAVGDMTTAFILLGGEDNSALAETVKNIEKALGVSMAFKGAIEGAISFQKLWNNTLKKTAVVQKIITAGQYLWGVAVGTTTGALKLLRLALIATGIGAIIVGIVALVMNFGKLVKWVKNITTGMGAFGKGVMAVIKFALAPLIAVIDAVKWGLQKLGILESEQEKAKRLRAKAEAKRTKEKLKSIAKQIKEIEKLSKLEQETTDLRIKGLDNEIKIQKSLGKDTIDLERQKLKILIDSTKRQDELTRERIRLKKIELGLLFDEIEASFRAQKFYEEANKIAETRKAAFEELDLELKKSTQTIKDSETDLLVFENEIQLEKRKVYKKTAEEKKKISDKEIVDTQKAADDKLKIEQDLSAKLLADEIKLEDQQWQLLQELTNTEHEFELLKLAQQYDKKNALAVGNAELINLLKEQEGKDAAAIDKKYRDAKIEADKEVNEKRIQMSLELATQSANALQSLGDAVFSHKMKNLKKGSREEEAVARKQFKFNKALQLSMAFIDAAKAITSSLAQSPLAIGPIPNPAGIASLAFAAITSAAQIATIAAQQFSGGGKSGGALNVSAGGIGGAAPQIAPVTNTSTLVPQEDQKVFVTETDISDTQNKVSVIEAQSTF